MNERVASKSLFLQIIFCTLIFLMVYLIGLNNYLLYHTLAEMFGIVVSIAIFIIAWNTRKNLDNNAFLIIGIAYLFIGAIDLLHLLAYKGMGVFKTGDANLPTQLWVSARLLQSISFLLAPFFIHRKVPAKTILLGYIGLTLFLIASIFYWKVFPVCFVEGSGLTPFKKIAEYVNCLMLALSIGMFFKNRQAFDETVLRYIMASLCLTIVSEVSLTLYAHPYSLSNFMGHYFKIISFYLIYKAIIETGLQRPYDVLFRNLKNNEKALSESEARYRSMMEAMQDPVYIASSDFTVSYMNPAMISWIGREAIGEHCYKALNGYDRKCEFCDFHKITQGGLEIKETFRQKDGRYYHVTHSPVHHVDGSVSKLTIFRDITGIRQIELQCRQERDKARLYLDIVGSIVIVLNPDTTVALINKKGCELLETDEKDIVGKKWFDTFVPEKDRKAAKSVFRDIMSGEIQYTEFYENLILSSKNDEKLILWHNSILRDENGVITGTLSSGDDITASRKVQRDLIWELGVNSALSELYIPLISPEISMQEIGSKILEKGKLITHSEHGFVSIIDPETGINTSHSFSEMMAECKENKTIVFPVGADGSYPGLWGYALNTLKPFFTNSPAEHPSQQGLPEGHRPIKNFLSIPVLFNEKLVGQIALGNKQDPFEERDVAAVSRLAQYYALAINRWLITDALRKSNDELEIRVKERTKALSEFNLLLVNEIEERKILEDNLLKSETELKDLSAKLIQSYEEERRRIGEELHDGLAQTLSAIKVWSDAAIAQMENNRPEASMESIRSILSLAKASVEEVRNIIKNMRPAILDDLGLKAAISWLCQEFEKTHEHIVVQKKLNLVDGEIFESLKVVIFRILQEALNNVSKHSRASAVSVLLDQGPDNIDLQVYDNGIGFNVDETPEALPREKGIGLTSMEQRARLSGGTFSINAAPARGAVIRVTWKI
ncbi:MAG: PAS domain S-box protein [Desulfobacteraceae bacterium]|nr:MAG: PAS domain S-box protein [Desulfobacteraceae bacterium]